MKEKIEIKEVKALLHWLTDVKASYTLVGGLAVSLWAETILPSKKKEELALPIFSKDIDFRGVRFLAEGIKSWLAENEMQSSTLTVAKRKNYEKMGKIFNFPFHPLTETSPIQSKGMIEILERLPLLDSGIDEEKKGKTIQLGKIKVLDPFSLMICKLHAYHTRSESEKNNDLHHMRILAHVVAHLKSKGLTTKMNLTQEAFRLKEILKDRRFPCPLSKKEMTLLKNGMEDFENPPDQKDGAPQLQPKEPKPPV